MSKQRLFGIQERCHPGQRVGPIDSNGYDVTESGAGDCRALGQPERPLCWALNRPQASELLSPACAGAFRGAGWWPGDSQLPTLSLLFVETAGVRLGLLKADASLVYFSSMGR